MALGWPTHLSPGLSHQSCPSPKLTKVEYHVGWERVDEWSLPVWQRTHARRRVTVRRWVGADAFGPAGSRDNVFEQKCALTPIYTS